MYTNLRSERAAILITVLAVILLVVVLAGAVIALIYNFIVGKCVPRDK